MHGLTFFSSGPQDLKTSFLPVSWAEKVGKLPSDGLGQKSDSGGQKSERRGRGVCGRSSAAKWAVLWDGVGGFVGRSGGVLWDGVGRFGMVLGLFWG